MNISPPAAHPPALSPHAVLDFWFCDRARALWFEKEPAFDAEIRDRFGAAIEHAIAGGFADWCADCDGTLALLILLDQMTRNIFRGDPRAFAGDERARAVAGAAIAAGLERSLPFARRRFFYLPYEHSEDPADQERSLALFGGLMSVAAPEELVEAEEQMAAVERHHYIIRRFGRFPHRNAVLGRVSTAEELAFLTEPNSSF